MDADTAVEIAFPQVSKIGTGWMYRAASGRGFTRTVASPRPRWRFGPRDGA